VRVCHAVSVWSSSTGLETMAPAVKRASSRTHPKNPKTKYIRQVGDYVDIKVNPAQQKGMPYLAYQGRTGIVWNVTPRAVGVEVNKQVRVSSGPPVRDIFVP